MPQDAAGKQADFKASVSAGNRQGTSPCITGPGEQLMHAGHQGSLRGGPSVVAQHGTSNAM